MKQYIYRVDPQDRIQFVDANWLAFARENGADALVEESVRGTSLWSHISDLTTRHLYKTIMTQVRESGRPVVVPFRCDQPAFRRYMALAVMRRPDLGVEFRSYLLREEVTERVTLHDVTMARNQELLRMCSWCKKVEVVEADWLEPDKAMWRLKLFEASTLPLITHVTCPMCEGNVLRELDKILV